MLKTKPSLWIDLTVESAEEIRDFYANVVGWESEPFDMDGYDDYVMKENKDAVAGICHARGVNEGIPSVWIPYFQVQSMEKSIKSCKERGGVVVCPVRSMGPDKSYAVIRDPSGAVCAVWTDQVTDF